MSMTETLELPAEDSVLAYTHAKRKQVVQELLPADGKLPADRDDLKIALATLNDMDRAALTRKRIKVDERTNNNQAAAAELVGKLLLAATAGGARPFQADVIEHRATPVLGADVPPPDLVEGETAIGSAQDSYEAFVGRTTA